LEESFPTSGKNERQISNPWKSIRPAGAEEQFSYDSLSNRIGFYNADGKPIPFGFDAQGRIIAITNALGKVTAFSHDVWVPFVCSFPPRSTKITRIVTGNKLNFSQNEAYLNRLSEKKEWICWKPA